MTNPRLFTFTFVTDFRGGTYCTQIQAENVFTSLLVWAQKLKTEKMEIKHLGSKTIEEIKVLATDEDSKPIPLTGLKNIWCADFKTRQGFILINIIKTNVT